MGSNVVNMKTEIEIVKECLEIERTRSKAYATQKMVRNNCFVQDPPEKPILNKVNREYHFTPKTKITDYIEFFWQPFRFTIVVGILGSIVGTVSPIIETLLGVAFGLSWYYVLFWFLFKRKKWEDKKKEKIESTKAYADYRVEADKKFDAEDAKLKEEYDLRMQEYNKAYAEYRNRKKKWNADHQEKLDFAQEQIDKIEELRDKEYSEYNLIPNKYHELEALEFIYDYMSSSRADLQTATEAYDREVQRRIEEQRIAEERRRQRELERRNDLLEQQRYYDDEDEYLSRNGFVRDTASTAIGTAIGTHGIRKEMERDRRERHESEKRYKQEEEKRKREEAHRSQVEFERVRKENAERRRKGQPELPLPPRWYY